MLKPFSAPLKVELANDGKSLTLLEPLTFIEYSHLTPLDEIIVPAGYVSDGFSNMGFNQILPRFGRGLKCAVLHDYLCDEARAGRNTRKYADKMFLKAMLEYRAFSKFKAYAIYCAVRLYAIFKGLK